MVACAIIRENLCIMKWKCLGDNIYSFDKMEQFLYLEVNFVMM